MATGEVVVRDPAGVLAEVRVYAAREASMYGVSADQYAEQNDSTREAAEIAAADAYRDIAALIDRLAPTLPVPVVAASDVNGVQREIRDDPWAIRSS